MFTDLEFDYTQEQQQKIVLLRDLVEKSRTLEIGTEDVLLSKFLNCAVWDVEKAYNGICRYYDFKAAHPKWTASHSVEYFREHFYHSLSKFVMPRPDKQGRAVVIFRTVDCFDKYPNYLYDIIEMDDLIFESLFLLPQVQKYGITIIYDLNGTTKNYIRLLSPSIARTINEKNEILPLTSRHVHMIQKGFIMNATSTLIMPFMSKELKKRVFTHDGKNFEKLRKMVGEECLPTEYGGAAGNVLDTNLIYNHMLKNKDYLMKLQGYRKSTQ